MSDLRIVVHDDADKVLLHSEATAAALRVVAEKVRKRVRAPKEFKISDRAGVGPRGAFSQVMMDGHGAVAVEFGTRSHAAKAPLRSALRGVK